jgi:hypothetical protein
MSDPEFPEPISHDDNISESTDIDDLSRYHHIPSPNILTHIANMLLPPHLEETRRRYLYVISPDELVKFRDEMVFTAQNTNDVGKRNFCLALIERCNRELYDRVLRWPLIDPSLACCDAVKQRMIESNNGQDTRIFSWSPHSHAFQCKVSRNAHRCVHEIKEWRYNIELKMEETQTLVQQFAISNNVSSLKWSIENHATLTPTKTQMSNATKKLIKTNWPYYDEDDDLCTLCLTNYTDIGYKPCGHAFICIECQRKLLNANKYDCCVCKERITEICELKSYHLYVKPVIVQQNN